MSLSVFDDVCQEKNIRNSIFITLNLETQGQVSVASHTKYHTFSDSGQSLQLAK